MGADDFQVTVRRKKLTCVLDPALVLGSPFGLMFALRLAQVVEPWLTRAFWQLIDASELLLPRLAAAPAAQAPLQPLAPVLRAWIALRDVTDAGSWRFRWIGDKLADSQLQDAADAGLLRRYEALAEAALRRNPPASVGRLAWPPAWDPLETSLDTLAVSAALDGALVLTAEVGDAAPWPVQALGRIGAAVNALQPMPAESLFAHERALLRDALAAAGLAGVAQQLPRLVALHLSLPQPADALLPAFDGADDPGGRPAAPAEGSPYPGLHPGLASYPAGSEAGDHGAGYGDADLAGYATATLAIAEAPAAPAPAAPPDPWDAARGWWYYV